MWFISFLEIWTGGTSNYKKNAEPTVYCTYKAISRRTYTFSFHDSIGISAFFFIRSIFSYGTWSFIWYYGFRSTSSRQVFGECLLNVSKRQKGELCSCSFWDLTFSYFFIRLLTKMNFFAYLINYLLFYREYLRTNYQSWY